MSATGLIGSYCRAFHVRSTRHFSVTCCKFRRKPKPVRDESKRNLQGEELAERLRRREEDILRQQPYKQGVSDVIARFKVEIEEEERRKHDIQGELMQRELQEREQALQNLAILTKSNEELKAQREKQNLVNEEKARLKLKEEEMLLEAERIEIHKRNTQLVLRVIEESRSFVTPENLEEKIEDALDNETNYNFALKPSGQKILSDKPPGNLDGWKGANPSAYALGGIQPGSSEWNYIFRSHRTTPSETSSEN